MEEYIKIWNKTKQKSGSPKKKFGWPANQSFFNKKTKKGPCTESGFAKKRTLE
jgi:hypothetical protein